MLAKGRVSCGRVRKSRLSDERNGTCCYGDDRAGEFFGFRPGVVVDGDSGRRCRVWAFPIRDKTLAQVPEHFEGATGLKFGEVMASLGNEYGLVITLDDAKKITIPMGNQKTLQVPEPGILLAIKVNNDLIFNSGG